MHMYAIWGSGITSVKRCHSPCKDSIYSWDPKSGSSDTKVLLLTPTIRCLPLSPCIQGLVLCHGAHWNIMQRHVMYSYGFAPVRELWSVKFKHLNCACSKSAFPSTAVDTTYIFKGQIPEGFREVLVSVYLFFLHHTGIKELNNILIQKDDTGQEFIIYRCDYVSKRTHTSQWWNY